MLQHFLKYIPVAALSALKVLPGAALGTGAGLPAWENFLVVFSGGFLGIVLYTFLGQQIRTWSKARRRKKPDYQQRIQRNYRWAKKIKRVWNRFGIVGIAFLTPPLLSPPVGTLVAVALHETKTRIFLFMGVSMALWSAIFCFLGDTIRNLIA
jgi:hypothetical protein